MKDIVTFELSQLEYLKLMELIAIGEYTRNAGCEPEELDEPAEVVRDLWKFRQFLFKEEEDHPALSELDELYHSGHESANEAKAVKYIEKAFLAGLSVQLAFRDVNLLGPEEKRQFTQEELNKMYEDREEFYDEEFENNGVKNIFVREPSK